MTSPGKDGDVANPNGTSASGAALRPGLVITAVGPDRPGLIFDIATQITHRGGNIEDTKMSKLGGMFAVMMMVTGSESVLSGLMALREQWDAQFGVHCFLLNTHANLAAEPNVWRFSASGLDRPGIVAHVSDLLAKRGVNVVSFLSRIEYAPLSGTPLFILEAECVLPASVASTNLEEDLRTACEKAGLELITSSQS